MMNLLLALRLHILLAGWMLISCSAVKQPPIKALLLTGGGWHDYEAQEELLTKGINERLGKQIEWTIIHEGNGEPDHHLSVLQKENWAEDYDVVIHNTGFGRVTDPDFVENFVKHHKGTPAVLIHASVHSYRYAEPADPWFEFTGLRSMAHEGQRRFEVENIAPDHPVMEGFPVVWMAPVDEIYIIEEVWGNITPLARAYGKETEKYHTVIWTHQNNGIKVFATTLGHNNEVFEEKVFLDNVANGILWAVGQL